MRGKHGRTLCATLIRNVKNGRNRRPWAHRSTIININPHRSQQRDTFPRIILSTIGWPEGWRTLRRGASHRVLYGSCTFVYPIFDNFHPERRSNNAQSCPPTLTGRRALGRAEALHPWVSPRLSPGPRRLTPYHTQGCSHVARTDVRMLGVPGR